MSLHSSYKTIFLDRMTAIMLLVRLENGDIPYPHSKQCREQLIYFLAYILTDEERTEKILEVDYDELNKFIDDTETAIRIIENYSNISKI